METKRSISIIRNKFHDDNSQLEHLQTHWKIAKPRRKTCTSTSRSPTPPKKMDDYVSHWKIPKSSSRPSSPSTEEDTHVINDNISKPLQPESLGTPHRNNLHASQESDVSVISGLLALSAPPPYTSYCFPCLNQTSNTPSPDRVLSCVDKRRKRPINNPSEDVQEPAWKKVCHRLSNRKLKHAIFTKYGNS